MPNETLIVHKKVFGFYYLKKKCSLYKNINGKYHAAKR